MNSSAKGDADQHSLAARFVDGPHVSAPDIAEQRLADWVNDLAPEQAAALDDLTARFPRARTVLLGIAEASPYLFDLVRIDGARALGLLECEPHGHLSQLIQETCRLISAAAAEPEVMQLLRRMKAEAALLIALCDIGGVWPVMQVTAALTDLAVASVRAALRYVLRQEAARGRLSPPDLDAPEEDSGVVVLAMGKMGAGELNYSSDIDLIVFFDPAAPTLAPDIEPQPFFVRVTQALARLLQQRTGDGYVFRVDLRLRPDPVIEPGGDFDRSGAALLRAGRADMGAGRHDQGAALRWRRKSRRSADGRNRAVRLAKAFGFRGACRHSRHETADADLSRPKRNLRRRPQRQGRPRRNTGNRVFRTDAAADRGRPAS